MAASSVDSVDLDGLIPGGSEGQGGNPQQQKAEAAEERRTQQEQMKNSILAQILDQEARARLNTLMLAKPEKGRAVEGLLMNMARQGQLGAKITEKDLIGLLEQVNRASQKTTTVKFDRRRCALDDDDEDYDL